MIDSFCESTFFRQTHSVREYGLFAHRSFAGGLSVRKMAADAHRLCFGICLVRETSLVTHRNCAEAFPCAKWRLTRTGCAAEYVSCAKRALSLTGALPEASPCVKRAVSLTSIFITSLLPGLEVRDGSVEVLKTLVIDVLQVVHHGVELHILVTAFPVIAKGVPDPPDLTVVAV